MILVLYFSYYPNFITKFHLSVDGGWTDYGDWSSCTKSCGIGEKVRTRTCTKPTPANGGKNCEGKSQEKTTCNTAPCPGYTPLLNI